MVAWENSSEAGTRSPRMQRRSVRAAHARLAAHQRHHGPDAPATAAAQAELRAALAEQYIADLVAGAPALSAQQRAALAVVLLSPSTGTPHDRPEGGADVAR
jgi:hypothetical protein